MKRTALPIFAGALSCVAVFLIFAFCAWNINPGDWSAPMREFCALIATIVFVCVAFAAPAIF